MEYFWVIQEVRPTIRSRFGVVQAVSPIKKEAFEVVQGVGLYGVRKNLDVVQHNEQTHTATQIKRIRN